MTSLKDHLIHLGNDGRLESNGNPETSSRPEDVRRLLTQTMPEIMKGWSRKRVLFYAHGGMNDEATGMDHAATWYRSYLDAEIYPIFFIWRTGFFETLANIIEGNAEKGLPDNVDDGLEHAVRKFAKRMWEQMKTSGLGASTKTQGGARLAAEILAGTPIASELEIHLVGHSAGSILHAPFAQLMGGKQNNDGPLARQPGYGLNLKTVSLWAPGITTEQFKRTYMPLLQRNELGTLHLYTLTDRMEKADNLVHVYHKSILYMVSNALESVARWDAEDGYPIVGMAKFVERDREIQQLIAQKRMHWVTAAEPGESVFQAASTATTHSEFSRDPTTIRDTINRILMKNL